MERSLRSVLREGRIYYIVVICIVIIAIYIPIRLSLPLRQNIADMYYGINQLKPTDNILIVSTLDSSMYKNSREGSLVVLKHLKILDCNIVAYSSGAEGATNIAGLFTLAWGPDWNKPPWYGTKFVWAGFIVAPEVNIYKDFWGSFSGMDAFQNPLSTLPLMANIHSAYDIRATVHMGQGLPAEAVFAYAYKDRNPPPWSFSCGTPQEASSYYWSRKTAGTAQGVIDGARGAAEYELVSGISGFAMSYQIAMAGVLGFVAFGIIVNNVIYATNRLRTHAKKVTIEREGM